MKVQVTGINKNTSSKESFVIEVADLTQAHRYCKQMLCLEGARITKCSDTMKVDIDFIDIQQYLSVRQYRRIRKQRGGSQFPVLMVKTTA